MVRVPNTHSGFYGARVFWKKNYVTCSARGWIFRPARKLSRGLAVMMEKPHGHARYVKVADTTNNREHAKVVYNKKVLKL